MKNSAARRLKQVPEDYLVIGVDPHKKRHAAVAITQDFNTQAKFKFDNTREGLETMLARARVEMVKSNCRGVIFAIETGGHYWRNIAYYLDEWGIPFRFINQFTLKRRRKVRTSTAERTTIETVRWQHNSYAPGSSLRVKYRRESMLTFVLPTMPIAGWSRKGPG
jgi:transposase